MPTFTHRTSIADVDYALRRRSGVWHYDFCYKTDHSRPFSLKEDRHRNSTHTSDLKQAKVYTERAIEAVLCAGSIELTLSGAITRYLEDRWPPHVRPNNSTYHDVKPRLGSFQILHGDKLISTAPKEVSQIVQAWLDERKLEGKSATTLNNDQRCVSRMFSWLSIRNLVNWPYNPAQRARLDVPKPDVKVKPPIDEGDVDKLMQAAKDHKIFPVLVLMQSGFRGVGSSQVKWSDIRLTAKPSVDVPIEKERTRTIPLSAWATRLLKAWRKKHPDDFFVYPFGLSQCQHDLMELRIAHQLPAAITLQSLRRLTYRRLYEAGVSPQLAAKIMGSSVPVAMKHYVDLETLNAHEAVKALQPMKKLSQKLSQVKRNKKRSKHAKH